MHIHFQNYFIEKFFHIHIISVDITALGIKNGVWGMAYYYCIFYVNPGTRPKMKLKLVILYVELFT